jgi:hypothetical protein
LTEQPGLHDVTSPSGLRPAAVQPDAIDPHAQAVSPFLNDATLNDKRASGTNSTTRFSALAELVESIPQSTRW